MVFINVDFGFPVTGGQTSIAACGAAPGKASSGGRTYQVVLRGVTLRSLRMHIFVYWSSARYFGYRCMYKEVFSSK